MSIRKDKKVSELLDLDVQEVSLVDKAANMQEFLIIKNEDTLDNIDQIVTVAKNNPESLSADTYLDTLNRIAKSVQKSDETFESAFVRALESADGISLYTAMEKVRYME